MAADSQGPRLGGPGWGAIQRMISTDVVTTARRNGSAWVPDGPKSVVSHEEAADQIIVSARTSGEHYGEDGIMLFPVDTTEPAVAWRRYLSGDDTRAANITLSDVAV